MVFTAQLNFQDDPYTSLNKFLPQLLKFILASMTHKKEIVKIAALKALEFILETHGCSLDAAIVLILKAIIGTYPDTRKPAEPYLMVQESFNTSLISTDLKEASSDQLQSPKDSGTAKQLSKLFKKGGAPGDTGFRFAPNEPTQVFEPASGFTLALKSLYNHVLDTYISVLSSISSHIMHQLFYEVIIPAIQERDKQRPIETKVFCVKIAEKIISICQGDLILPKAFLETLLGARAQPEPLGPALKNLWQSIRQRVFTNYSAKGLRTLIEWVVSKLVELTKNEKEISKLELTEQEMMDLGHLIDIIGLVSAGRKKNEEEANSLIQIKVDYCLDLYLLLNPLLYWLDFSVERDDRLSLFKTIYKTIKDVLENLPPQKVDIDMLSIMLPILKRTSQFLKGNSPQLNMLKFLDFVLKDVEAEGPDVLPLFVELMGNFVPHIANSLFEEVFMIFDKLL